MTTTPSDPSGPDATPAAASAPVPAPVGIDAASDSASASAPPSGEGGSRSGSEAAAASLAEPAIPAVDWRGEPGILMFSVFLWIAYHDRLGASALAAGGLGWAIAGLALGALVGGGLLTRRAALAGLRERLAVREMWRGRIGEGGPIGWIAAALAFSAWVGWLVLALDYGLRPLFRGLADLALAAELPPARVGSLPSEPVVWLAIPFWSLVVCWIGGSILTARLIQAVARVFVVLPAIAFGYAVILTCWRFVEGSADAAALPGVRESGPGDWRAGAEAMRWSLIFLGASAWFAADWGRALRGRGDAAGLGWACAGGGAWIVGTLALAMTAILAGDPADPGSGLTTYLSLPRGWIGAAVCAVFALGSLGHAVLSARAALDSVGASSGMASTGLGALAAAVWLAGLAARPEILLGALGAFALPVAAVLAFGRSGPAARPWNRAALLVGWALAALDPLLRLVAGVDVAVPASVSVSVPPLSRHALADAPWLALGALCAGAFAAAPRRFVFRRDPA